MKPQEIWAKELQHAIDKGFLTESNGDYSITDSGLELVEKIVAIDPKAADFLRTVQHDLEHGTLTIICIAMRKYLRHLH